MFKGVDARQHTQGYHALESSVLTNICKKVVNLNEMPKLKKDVVTTLCMLEMEIPLAFFDVMIHLVLHLVEELDLCGPISTLWMYCI
jgi:hypothetical protein